VKSYGFECEKYEFDTDDGYILTVHRILPKNKFHIQPHPVLMVHGILGSSGDFVMSGIDSPGLFLANNGFDTWIGNVRGNRFSIKHKNMTSMNPNYWNFTFHEIGLFDVPAMIDNILEVTNSEKLIYISHSQGGASALVMLSIFPEYNQKISQLHLIAPSAYWGNFGNINFKNFVIKPWLESFKNAKTYNQLASEFFKSFTDFMFSFYDSLPKTQFCQLFSPLLCGSNFNCSRNYVYEYVPKFLSRTVSMKQFLHFFQLIFSEKFRQFDYGVKNIEIYGNSEPPEYNLNNVLTKTYIYGGDEDGVVSLTDVKILKKQLKNVKFSKTLHHYNHCDLIFGEKVKEDYFEKILRVMKDE
jgi:pimeloyl-ACP methyl ester carboxylesterase